MFNYLTGEQKKALFADIMDKLKGNSTLEWSDIADQYDLTMNPETLRKATTGLRLAMEAGCLDENGDGNANGGYEKEFADRAWLADQRREYNKLLREDARSEHLLKVFEREAAALKFERPLLSEYPPPQWDEDTKKYGLLLLSDWHYGMVANNIFNTYNTAICRERVAEVLAQTLYQSQVHKLQHLHIAILGDMIEGCLRASSRVASEEMAVEQVMHVSELLAEVIEELARHVPKVSVYGTWGNHGRMVQKYDESLHGDNVEKIIYWWLKTRLEGKENIDMRSQSYFELIEMTIAGQSIVATHGDLDKSKDAALKLNAVQTQQCGSGINCLILGHTHEEEQCAPVGIKTIHVGSLCGVNEHAKNKRMFSMPSQTLLVFREGYGLETRCDFPL